MGKTEIELIKKVTESGNWSYNGPMETEFKKKWAAFNGSKYAILVANGKSKSLTGIGSIRNRLWR